MKNPSFKTITLEELAAIVSSKLQKHNIDCILVGGGCVTIYSQNEYQSYDLDYVTYEDMKKITHCLSELNFRKKDRYFIHPDCKFFIEFVAPPVAIGNEPIEQFEHRKTSLGTIKMLTPTDSVKDRLVSYFHWEDRQSLDQAIAICKETNLEIDLEEIKNWSKKEDNLEKYQVFIELLNIT